MPVKLGHCPRRNLRRLQSNDRAMIRQISSFKPEDVATVRSNELLAKFELEDLELILRERRFCWFGHMECFSGPATPDSAESSLYVDEKSLDPDQLASAEASCQTWIHTVFKRR